MKTLRIGLLNCEPVISQKELPVLMLFGAVWDRPSRMLQQCIEIAGKKYDKKIITAYVDLDYAQELFSKFDVSDIPTMIIFEDGVPFMRKEGYRGTNDVEEFLFKFFGVLPKKPKR